MDESYYRYFESAFETASEDAEPPHAGREWLPMRRNARRVVTAQVQQAIRGADAALEENGRRLRPDARWFLLLVFSELMAQPVIAVRPDVPEEVLAQLAADVQTVALAAGERTYEHEVSSHVIVDALSQRWDDLELTRARWWE